jgi:hypothetical protein
MNACSHSTANEMFRQLAHSQELQGNPPLSAQLQASLSKYEHLRMTIELFAELKVANILHLPQR